MKRLFSLFLIFLLLSIQPQVLAWNKAGHMITAAFAYAQLSPDIQQRLTDILKAHPDADAWRLQIRNEVVGLDLGIHLLMGASAWPDDIRRKGHLHDHADWHYMNYPLHPPGFAQEPSVTGKLLTAIDTCKSKIRDANSTSEEKAIYLSWLVHLIGDLHQPLHTTTYISEQWPTGDHGGNGFYVKPATASINLHNMWDGMLGRQTDPSAAKNYATHLKAQHPKDSLKELAKATTPMDWTLESRAVAIKTVYLNGKLKGTHATGDAPALPEGYTKQAKAAAEKQAALAGYRLARVIEELLDGN